jgi:hypothetical protein
MPIGIFRMLLTLFMSLTFYFCQGFANLALKSKIINFAVNISQVHYNM